MTRDHVTKPAWPNIRDGSFASTIAVEAAEACAVALVGMPDDTGVGLNGGQPGAAEGPAAFREALARYGTARPSGLEWPAVFDAGDVTPGRTIEQTHDRVGDVVAGIVSRGMVPVGIGGGHDLTFAFVRGAMRHARAPFAGIYLDAHLDVRETVGSGMPFRRLIEDCGVERLDVVGLDPFVNSREHTAWFVEHGGRIDSLAPGEGWPSGDIFVSIDLDSIDAAFAPGVSARNPNGLTPGVAAAWARAAGRCPRVRCFDIMELCPPRDHDGRTARLAAHLFLSFLAGFAERSTAEDA